MIQHADRGAASGIRAGRIGDESDSIALQGGEIRFFELVNAERNGTPGCPGKNQEEAGGTYRRLKR